MYNEKYIDIFKRLVKAYNEDTLKEEYEKLIENADSDKIKKYIFAAMGIDYVENASCDDLKKSMDMKKMKGKIVIKVGSCGIRCLDKDGITKCEKSCPFGAVEVNLEEGSTIINNSCTDCGECITACDYGNIIDKIEFLPLIKYLRGNERVYAIAAPAYIGQFGGSITPSILRAALKKIGFYDMVEVALFADILTFKEAVEFTKNINKKEDFMITSCCCPMWTAMIKRLYSDLIKHVPPSVSPMIACGRTIKEIDKNSKVVFIGPCIAKKAEAKEKGIDDAVDFVLTFQELDAIFKTLNIDISKIDGIEGEHASMSGRIYGFSGGVSRAVASTVMKLDPDRDIRVEAAKADGISECKAILNKLISSEICANFIEGMGCTGGCVGGPKALKPKDEGYKNVLEYGNETDMITPLDNPCVYSTLKSIGINEIEELYKGSKKGIYEREF